MNMPGGASVGFKTSEPLLTKGLEYLQYMKEDAEHAGCLRT
jgi:hypothetical protein